MHPDAPAEVLSLHAESRDLYRAIVSVAGWFRVRDHADGTWLYAPTATGVGRPLDEAVAAIVERARRERDRAEADQEVAERQGEVHAPTVARPASRVESQTGGAL